MTQRTPSLTGHPLIRARGIRKTIKHKTVIRSANLDIQAGERVLIVGPSGCGKTTFLNILACIEPPSRGQVLVGGRDPWKENNIDRFRQENFGFVFQSPILIRELTGLENVMLPGLAYSRGLDTKNRALKLLEVLGFDTTRPAGRSFSARQAHKPKMYNGSIYSARKKRKASPDQKSWEYSGGEQQRIAIARALINRPKMIFADEPTGNLDEKLTEEVVHLLFGKATQGLAVIMVTHDPWIIEFGRASGYTIASLKGGKLKTKDSLEDRHRPSSSRLPI